MHDLMNIKLHQVAISYRCRLVFTHQYYSVPSTRACLDHLAKWSMIVTSATGDRDHQRHLVTNWCMYAGRRSSNPHPVYVNVTY